MQGKNRKLINLIFLLAFLSVTVLINLCHTEASFMKDPYCPACSFQSSCLATATIHCFQLPELAPVEFLDDLEALHFTSEIIVNFTSRSPPLI